MFFSWPLRLRRHGTSDEAIQDGVCLSLIDLVKPLLIVGGVPRGGSGRWIR
jgi:hypothetical protein